MAADEPVDEIEAWMKALWNFLDAPSADLAANDPEDGDAATRWDNR